MFLMLTVVFQSGDHFDAQRELEPNFPPYARVANRHISPDLTKTLRYTTAYVVVLGLHKSTQPDHHAEILLAETLQGLSVALCPANGALLQG